jgi:hypothetical protein
MSDKPNLLIYKRLKTIEDRIVRLAFLNAHLRKFKDDKTKLKDYSRATEGVSLFYYYSLSQFILEINKLFDASTDEYFTLPKLLNHIESNIKNIEWYKFSVAYPRLTREQLSSKEAIWSSGEKTEWYEKALGNELYEKKKMVSDLKMRITKNQKDLEKIKLARDKAIAHLDKEFLKYNFNINLEIIEKLLRLALEVFNTLNREFKGSTIYIDHIARDVISTLDPITKFHQIRRKVISTKRTQENVIKIEELNEIIK